MYRGIYAYAWDLCRQPVAATVAELRGCGLNTLTFATSYHAGKFIHPRNVTGKVYFPQDGTVYFRAHGEKYGKLKPEPNELVNEKDILAELCRRDDIAVNGWTVLLHNSRLGLLHPETTVVNVFGDRSVYSLCPLNPDVRAYAVALCKDLTDSYPLASIALETPGFLPFVHGYHHEFAQIEQNDWINSLLALCFCPSCAAASEKHGIDPAGLRQRLAKQVHDYLTSTVSVAVDMAKHWLLADVIGDQELAAFLRWRSQQVTALVKEIHSELRRDVALTVIPTVQRPSSAAWLEGTDFAALAEFVDALEVPFYEPDPERIASDAWDIARRAGGASVLRGILRPGPPDMHSQQQVSASLRALRDQGISDVAFYNYGLLRQINLDWLAAALAES